MMLEIFGTDQFEQGSEEWRRVRAGMPTASEFATVMRTSGRASDGTSKERSTYLHKIAGEVITGEPCENYKNEYMQRGNAMEAEALDMYAMITATDPHRIAFAKNGKAGASPDALVDEDGMVEIKTMAPHLLIELLQRPASYVPPEHIPQTQGGMWVLGPKRVWCDLMIYYRKMPPFIRRLPRDPMMISEIERSVDIFNQDVRRLVALIEAMRK